LFFCRKRKISKKKKRETKGKRKGKINKGFKTLNNGYFWEEKEDLTAIKAIARQNLIEARGSSTFFSRTSL